MNKFSQSILSWLLGLFLITPIALGADTISITIPGGPSKQCELIKMSKAGVVLKIDGVEQTLPLKLLSLADVQSCYKKIENKDAALRFDIGSFFFEKQLWTEAEQELREAAKLDSKLADKVAPLLKTIEEKKAPPATPTPPATTTPPATPADKPASDISKPPELPTEPIKKEASTETPKEPAKKDPETKEVTVEVPPGGGENFIKYMHMEVPPRSPAEMKEFLDKRLEELKKEIGGNWRMNETQHFYFFSNLTDEFHQKAMIWNEEFYKIWCIVLQHKEGEKLWNNKCPIYYFRAFKEFQKFAAELDHGMPNSGGYCMYRGRDVHICIPFYGERGGERGAAMLARNTFKHEGTHGFLQVSGEDVPISRSIHEGLAQFMQFWKFMDDDKCPERTRMVNILTRNIRAGTIPGWEVMKERPQGGMDYDGYAWAFAKITFLYDYGRQRFNDKTRLPKMIRLIKSGKTEEEAMAAAYEMSVDKLENNFHIWLNDMCQKNFPEIK